MGRHLLLVAALVACKGGGRDAPAPSPKEAAAAKDAAPAWADRVELPETSRRLDPAPENGPVVAITKSAILVDGTAIVPIANGAVDPGEKDGGAMGMRIPKLTQALAKAPPGSAPLQLAVDRATPYRVFIEVMFSAKQEAAGWKRFAILTRDGARVGQVPIALPDKAPASSQGAFDVIEPTADDGLRAIRAKYLPGIKRCFTELLKQQPNAGGRVALSIQVSDIGRVTSGTARGFDAGVDRCIERLMKTWRFAPREGGYTITAPLYLTGEGGSTPEVAHLETLPSRAPQADQAVRMFVSLTATETLVWSVSGLEGTLAAPKLRVASDDPDALTKLERALAEIVDRRWGGKAARERDREIVLQADGKIPMQRVVEVMAAIRPAFPDVLLSTGFE